MKQKAHKARSLRRLVSCALCWVFGHKMETTETHYGSTDGTLLGVYSWKEITLHANCRRCMHANDKMRDGQ